MGWDERLSISRIERVPSLAHDMMSNKVYVIEPHEENRLCRDCNQTRIEFWTFGQNGRSHFIAKNKEGVSVYGGGGLISRSLLPLCSAPQAYFCNKCNIFDERAFFSSFQQSYSSPSTFFYSRKPWHQDYICHFIHGEQYFHLTEICLKMRCKKQKYDTKKTRAMI